MIPVADAHCDFLYYAVHNGWDIMEPRRDQAVALPYLKEGNVKLQTFAVWPDVKLKTNCLQQAMDTIDTYWSMLDKYSDFTPYYSAFRPKNDERIATVLTLEGGEALNGSLANLRMFYRLGVRAMTLTWNHTNELADPAMRKKPGGLTVLGRSVVREMDRIGMALDIAHLSDMGIDEIMELYRRPIIASHSNARAVCAHPRSLTDDHIERIAKGGGVVCVNFYPPQLTSGRASIDDVVLHIKHIASVGGVDCVGLGSDFDGMTEYPRGICCSGDMLALLEKLMQAGFTAEDTEKIAYNNLSAFYDRFM